MYIFQSVKTNSFHISKAYTLITLEKLQKMTTQERHQLYLNAHKLRDRGGQEVLDLLLASGLPMHQGALTNDDPMFLRMQEIIWAKDVQELLIAATQKGLPALAGVDAILANEFGSQYSKIHLVTHSAGSVVAQVMRMRGYNMIQESAKMPEGSIAKTAALWG